MVSLKFQSLQPIEDENGGKENQPLAVLYDKKNGFCVIKKTTYQSKTNKKLD